jgi:hypothetical protein
MLTGAHAIIYSTNVDADRAFLRDVLALPHVDVGGGWLIFGLPPAEVAVHPAERNDKHELYLICDDVQAFVSQMTERGATCGEVKDQGWGLLTDVVLPGGGKLGVYEPRHARPASAPVKGNKTDGVKPAKKTEKKPDKKAEKKADKKAAKGAGKKGDRKAEKKAEKKADKKKSKKR